MPRIALTTVWYGGLGLVLGIAACDKNGSESTHDRALAEDAGAEAGSSEAGDDAGTDIEGDAAVAGEACGSASSASLPAAYPEAWEVSFVAVNPLPADYSFGHRETVLPAGSTYGDQTLPLGCDVSWERDVPVTLRDCSQIYVDLLKPPEATGPLPSIVAWSPYGKALPTAPPTTVPKDRFSGVAKFEGPDAAFWVCQGYALVNVDVRGAYKSEGRIQSFGRVDAADGYEVIEWIAQQPWSNGNVGMHGASWLAIAQWNIAATRPPHLKAIAPWNGQSDLYRNSLVLGGIPDIAFSSNVGSTLVSDGGGVEDTVGALDRHPLWDAYWGDKRPRVEDITAAAYVGADIATALHTAGTLDAFRRLGSAEKWLRVNDTNEWYDQYTRENEEDLLRFFDHYLKGDDNGWEQTPPVRVTVMDPGADGEHKVNTPYEAWPVPDTEYRKLYLDGEKGGLATTAPSSAAQVSYDAQSGQTTFTMRVEQDMQVVGHGMARLYVQADGAQDMDVFVLVEKLEGDGTLLVPSELAAQYFPAPPPGVPGRQRASMRKLDEDESTDFLPVHAFDESQKLGGGEIVAIDIALMPTAMRWHAGQQLRLTIAGTYVRGSGLPLPTLNDGTHVIHTGAEHASYLQLPIVPFTP